MTSTSYYGPCRRKPEPASFLKNLRCILLTEDPSVISWSEDGRITISDPISLSNDILHRYFRHKQFSSFQRQLNYFGYYKLAGKGKISKCIYTNDALPQAGGGTPGEDAPPYTIDSLLRLKRKSNHERGAYSPSSSSKRGATNVELSSSPLKYHIGSSLSSSDEVFDWAEPLDDTHLEENENGDISPTHLAYLLADDLPQSQHPPPPPPPPPPLATDQHQRMIGTHESNEARTKQQQIRFFSPPMDHRLRYQQQRHSFPSLVDDALPTAVRGASWKGQFSTAQTKPPAVPFGPKPQSHHYQDTDTFAFYAPENA